MRVSVNNFFGFGITQERERKEANTVKNVKR